MLPEHLLRLVICMTPALWLTDMETRFIDLQSPVKQDIFNAAYACVVCHHYVDTFDAMLIFCDYDASFRPHCAYVHFGCQEKPITLSKGTCPSCGMHLEWF